jgi:tetratricopeptide (TPR) repeat protein
MNVRFPTFALAAVLALSPVVAEAERYERPEATQPCEETLALQHIFELAGRAEQLRLLEDFYRRFPKHPARGWVLEQTQILLAARQQWREAITAGERLLDLDPDDVEAAYRNLKAAEGAQDAQAVRTHSAKAWEVAGRVALRQDAPQAELARQVIQYCEYLDYLEITKASDPKQRLGLMAEFERKHPRSPYLGNVQSLYFPTYEQLGDRAKVVALAERMVAEGTASEELTVSVAEHYFKAGDFDKALRYSAKAIDAAGQRRNGGAADPDSEKQKARTLGRAYWMAGKIQMERGQFAAADSLLRQALNGLRGNDAVTGAVLFHLGWVNYKLGNLVDAEKFNQSCLQYRGPYQDAARRNLEVIRVERSAN